MTGARPEWLLSLPWWQVLLGAQLVTLLVTEGLLVPLSILFQDRKSVV
jgi:hypothetical protein